MQDDFKTRWKGHLPWLGAIVTGLLLVASFPPLEMKEAAWLALVPLVLASRAFPVRRAFGLGYLAGIVFWLLTLSWLRYVTVAGWILLSLYSALYLAPFAAFCSAWLRRRDPAKWWNNLGFVFLAPMVWVALEYARSTLFTGFPWNTLGTSQFPFVPLLHIASWGGVYAVSALLILLNAGMAATVFRYRVGGAHWGRNAHPELLLPFVFLALSMSWGLGEIRGDQAVRTPVQIGIVQPNIPQPFKWDDGTIDLIFQRLQTLTEALHQQGNVDLVIWPETALPDDVRNNPSCYDLVRALTWQKAPLLVGSMDTALSETGEEIYYNSSFLFDATGALVQGYDKQHLVVGGEYIPFEDVLPWLKALTPNEASFTPGTNATVFALDRPDIRFASLICFEDALPYLSRRAVRAGARLLVNQTNDAWFEKSSASRQHMAHCILRCVENGVPAVRAANTGISCHIDHHGILRSVLQDAEGNTFIANTLKDWVLVPQEDMPLTFYTRHGDLFAWSCVAATGAWGLLAMLGVRSRRVQPFETPGS